MRVSSVRWDRFDKKLILTCTNSKFRTISSLKYSQKKIIDPSFVSSSLYIFFYLSYFFRLFNSTFKYPRQIISNRLSPSLFFFTCVALHTDTSHESSNENVTSARAFCSSCSYHCNTVTKYNLHETCIHLSRIFSPLLCTEIFRRLIVVWNPQRLQLTKVKYKKVDNGFVHTMLLLLPNGKCRIFEFIQNEFACLWLHVTCRTFGPLYH